MDPLSVFSLVCGVIQVLDCSIRSAAKCKEIYDNGITHEYGELEEVAKHLDDLESRLNLQKSHQDATRLQNSVDKLSQIAEECSKTAKELLSKVHTVKIEGPRRKRDALKKTVKGFWEKRDIQEIQKRLASHQRMLDSEILIGLRCVLWLK